MPKVFIIGPNKCGTSSLHHLFKKSGMKSVHHNYRKGRFIAQKIITNASLKRPLLHQIEEFDAYGDMNFANNRMAIEANIFFKELDKQYPGSKFILNTRPVENWILSRSKHKSRFGSYLGRYKEIFETEDDGVVFEAWQSWFQDQFTDITNYFRDRDNFLIFDIENDDPAKIAEFLKPEFSIDVTAWEQKNKTRRS